MGKIVDFVIAAMPARTHAPATAAGKQPQASPDMSRDRILREVAAMYAEALEYPEEVFTESVELEAELGIDSVKQTELLGRLSEKYNLPPRPADFRLSNYSTLGKVVDFVQAAAQRQLTSPVARERQRPESQALSSVA